jgi:hypothetical protein
MGAMSTVSGGQPRAVIVIPASLERNPLLPDARVRRILGSRCRDRPGGHRSRTSAEEISMPNLNARTYYAIAMPIAVAIYVLVIFLTNFNLFVLIVGALLIAVVAVSGRWVVPRRRGRPTSGSGL